METKNNSRTTTKNIYERMYNSASAGSFSSLTVAGATPGASSGWREGVDRGHFCIDVLFPWPGTGCYLVA